MTSHETAIAPSEWRTLQGVVLEGGYELKNAIELKDAEAAFKVHVLGGGGLEAIAKFYSAEPAILDGQLLLWQTLTELPHPNLATPLAAGRTSISGAEAVYVVLAIPDEKLSGVAAERALTEEEAGEILQSVASALEHLHANGLAHGCVSPETVLATGYAVQLSSECVRWLNAPPPVETTQAAYLAPESDAVNKTAVADVWCLGATLFQVLSQKPYDADSLPEAAGLPLAVLLRRCLAADPHTRCQFAEARAIVEQGPTAAIYVPPDDVPESHPSLPEVAPAPAPPIDTAILNGQPVEVPKTEPPDVTAQPVKVGDTAVMSVPIPVEARHEPIRSKRQPIEAKVKLLEAKTTSEDMLALTKFVPADLSQRRVRLKTRPGAWRGAIAGAVGLLMLFALIWLVVIPRFQSPLAPADVKEIAQTVPAPPQGKAWPTRTLSAADAASPHAANEDARTLPPATLRDKLVPRDKWRVVLYAYEHQQDAERRIELVNHNHPGLRAHLFTASNGAPYFVVTGGALSHDQAVALRLKAIRLGLPLAVQIQSFSR